MHLLGGGWAAGPIGERFRFLDFQAQAFLQQTTKAGGVAQANKTSGQLSVEHIFGFNGAKRCQDCQVMVSCMQDQVPCFQEGDSGNQKGFILGIDQYTAPRPIGDLDPHEFRNKAALGMEFAIHGQLTVAEEVFAELGITDIGLAAIAKGPDRNAGRERFFLPGRKPFSLESNHPALYFLQRLRDEAHRFAISGHRAKRARVRTTSPLEGIPGVGAIRRRALLRHFGGLRQVRSAGIDDLLRVSGISRPIAQRVYDYLHQG